MNVNSETKPSYYLLILIFTIQTIVTLFFKEYSVVTISIAFSLLIYISLKNPSRFDEIVKNSFTNKAFFYILATQLLFVLYQDILDYYKFNYNIYDTGSFAQGIAHFNATGKYYNYTIGAPALGDHFTPSLLIFAPLFKLINTSWWLTGAKILFWVLTAFSLRKLATLHELNQSTSNMIALIWVLSAPYLNVLNFEFQPSNLSCLAITYSLVLWKQRKFVWYSLLLLWAVFLKENMPLILICNGMIIFLLEKKYKLGIIHIAIGLFLGFFIFYELTPLITGVENMHKSALGPFSLFDKKIEMILFISFSVGFLTLADYRVILVLIASFGLSLMSNHDGHLSTYFHYHDLPIAYATVLCIFSIKQLQSNSLVSIISYLDIKRFLIVTSLSIFIYINANNTFLYNIIFDRCEMKERFDLLSAVKKADKELDKNNQIIVQDCFGIYFLDFPYMTSFDKPKRHIDQEKANQYVVLNPIVNRWPIHNEFSTILNELNLEVAKGTYKKLDQYMPLLVYQKTDKKFNMEKDTLCFEVELLFTSTDMKMAKSKDLSNHKAVFDTIPDNGLSFWGPYVPLAKGKYIVKLKSKNIGITNLDESIGTFDIVSQFGTTVHLLKDIKLDETIELELMDDVKDIEFRLKAKTNQAYFDKITVAKKF